MSHRLIEIEQVDRHGPKISYEEAIKLPVMIPSLAAPARTHYAYRWVCACEAVGAWVATRDQGIDGWSAHVLEPAVVDEEEIRDEIVRLVDQTFGGLAGLQQFVALSAASMEAAAKLSGCPDCGRGEDEGHEPGCFYAS